MLVSSNRIICEPSPKVGWDGFFFMRSVLLLRPLLGCHARAPAHALWHHRHTVRAGTQTTVAAPFIHHDLVDLVETYDTWLCFMPCPLHVPRWYYTRPT